LAATIQGFAWSKSRNQVARLILAKQNLCIAESRVTPTARLPFGQASERGKSQRATRLQVGTRLFIRRPVGCGRHEMVTGGCV